jgi:hypothetical protein
MHGEAAQVLLNPCWPLSSLICSCKRAVGCKTKLSIKHMPKNRMYQSRDRLALPMISLLQKGTQKKGLQRSEPLENYLLGRAEPAGSDGRYGAAGKKTRKTARGKQARKNDRGQDLKERGRREGGRKRNKRMEKNYFHFFILHKERV